MIGDYRVMETIGRGVSGKLCALFLSHMYTYATIIHENIEFREVEGTHSNFLLTKFVHITFTLGKVKLGIHVHTGEQVAIKIIPRQQMNHSSLVAQAVERELAVLQLLDHPHLVELRHVMQDTLNVYFVMEYMNGGDLYQVLSSQVCGRLSEYQARSYFGQLVGALAWCHTHHIW